MKTVCILLACCGASVVDAHKLKGFDILAALHHKGGHKKHHTKAQLAKNDPMGVMSSIMAAAQQSMSVAEKHHSVVVEQARQNISNLLEKESKVLSQAIVSFKGDLSKASVGVERTINATASAVVKAEKEEAPKANSWDSSAAMDRAQLNAQKKAAQTDLEKSNRQSVHKVTQATGEASQLLEDGVGKLSFKVGDVSDLVKKAQTHVEDAIGAAGVAEKAASFVQKSGSNVDMTNAAALMQSSAQQADIDRVAAKKHLDGVFAQVAKDLTEGTNSVLDNLAAAVKMEFNQIHEPVSTVPVPPVHSKRTLRHNLQKH